MEVWLTVQRIGKKAHSEYVYQSNRISIAEYSSAYYQVAGQITKISVSAGVYAGVENFNQLPIKQSNRGR